MTSTNMFQGLDNGAKPSSRVLQPPGGGSSNLFGGYEEDSAPRRKPNKMASKVFAPPEDSQSGSRRSNPPGGKSSGIFGDPEPPAQTQKAMPPGGPASNIFGAAGSAPAESSSRGHPNKPKDNLTVGPEPESTPEAKVSQPEVKEEPAPPAPVVVKEEPEIVSAPPQPAPASSAADEEALKKHEPHLGPRPRSHNRVINPPGGKSSVVFY
ncbi:jupiter microtubule associated homolog 2 [Cololabis saira]|uniref:jupiter microtubule associated homolog 2 n=1 Tax=Cololabis saira TaxID=129043 RepID=UPI002AD45C78|nr:jupiter microtubule associated homolog 2 [Cololabis saira]